MKTRVIIFGVVAYSVLLSVFFSGPAYAQIVFRPRSDFHAGIHSGDWTVERAKILEAASKNPCLNCKNPNCNRCALHLADYGHEYQHIHGPNVRQPFYAGTAGRTAFGSKHGYDEHSLWARCPGQPASVMLWEYRWTLNHAIDDQVRARNAVAAQEAAEDWLDDLLFEYDLLRQRIQESEAAWHWSEREPFVCADCHACKPCSSANEKGAMVVTSIPCSCCDLCKARRDWLRDLADLAKLERMIAAADMNLESLTAFADKKVEIALRSKHDAEVATRIPRVYHKPPRYQDVLAEQERLEKAKEQNQAE